MGVRGRNSEKKIAEKHKINLHVAQKRFTRAKALRALNAGSDPNTVVKDEKGLESGLFTNHPNYHVRRRAWQLRGCPELDAKTQTELHIKPPSEASVDQVFEPETQANLEATFEAVKG